MDRRNFLQTSAAALSALAASAAISKVRAGMLGTGHSHFGGKFKAMMDSPDYEVVGIAEADGAAKARLEKDSRFSSIQWMSEQELLGDASLHLIVVECRAWEAVPWGRKVIDARKHLHLEKPPGNEFEPFKKLIEDARRNKLLVQTGYLWRWHQGVNAALEAARKGWLGEVFMVRGTMNSDRGAGERAIEARYRGGGLFELSGHVIDPVVELLGRPKAVKSWLRHDTSVADKLADNNLAVLEYDKALAVITQAAKMAGSGDHRSFEVLGTDGSFVVHPESNPPRMRVYMKAAQGPYKAGWQEMRLPPQPRFIGDFKELARAIQSGTPLKHSYDHELLLHETLLRASGEMA
ncbi:MAG TPA: Gfo/Idh/MocA family oxidoreductase [Bryobacteraceae bacterium]|nr:Gfo/Idh/MocA family oxidoreductase [Bryobacteraceae bacterium]